METNRENLLMKCDRLTLKLPEKNENADGTACAEDKNLTKIAHCECSIKNILEHKMFQMEQEMFANKKFAKSNKKRL